MNKKPEMISIKPDRAGYLQMLVAVAAHGSEHKAWAKKELMKFSADEIRLAVRKLGISYDELMG